ncbi:DUF4145 domain-containing protein [Streptomyces sp. NPDC060035]|uniref:DUF4145 domain-containing protein n=1 Tax=Streptomyces sp. NPDC060035 TaxID=3347044 RepID=UPI0036A9ECC8
MDDRLRDLAKASPNCGILYRHQPLLALYGALAELNVFSNSNAAQVQAGRFGDVLAEELVTRTGLRVAGCRQVDRLRALTDTGALTPEVHDAFDRLRRDRNLAAHAHLFDTTRALEAVRLAYELGVFHHRDRLDRPGGAGHRSRPRRVSAATAARRQGGREHHTDPRGAPGAPSACTSA